MSTDKWKNKDDMVYTMEYYSVIKKNEIMPFAATWREIIILSEVNETKGNNMISLMCGIKKMI